MYSFVRVCLPKQPSRVFRASYSFTRHHLNGQAQDCKPQSRPVADSGALDVTSKTNHIHTIYQGRKMSSFSNADTGNKTADPYTAQNKQEPSLKEKVEDLFTFIDKTKICLMTAQTAGSDLLTSRAMALAAKVCCLHDGTALHRHITQGVLMSGLCRLFSDNCTILTPNRRATASIFSSTPTPNRARQTIFRHTLLSTSVSSTTLENGLPYLAMLPSRQTVALSKNTTHLHLRHGSVISATASMMEVQRTLESVSFA